MPSCLCGLPLVLFGPFPNTIDLFLFFYFLWHWVMDRQGQEQHDEQMCSLLPSQYTYGIWLWYCISSHVDLHLCCLLTHLIKKIGRTQWFKVCGCWRQLEWIFWLVLIVVPSTLNDNISYLITPHLWLCDDCTTCFWQPELTNSFNIPCVHMPHSTSRDLHCMQLIQENGSP